MSSPRRGRFSSKALEPPPGYLEGIVRVADEIESYEGKLRGRFLIGYLQEREELEQKWLERQAAQRPVNFKRRGERH